MGSRVSEKKVVALAEERVAAKRAWHHHYLPPCCKFNPDGRNHYLVLEDEAGGRVFHSASKAKPLKALTRLEKLFFGRK